MIFKNSHRAKKMFPDLQSGTAAAVSLARFVQEPLAEICHMWWSADSSGSFGFELLFLDIHPNRHLLKGHNRVLLRTFERHLVDAVCDVGVDINQAVSYDHVAPMLAFVAGLGLRKADALRNSIRSGSGTGVTGSFVECRKDLLRLKLLGNIVYTNAAGFLRIRNENFLVHNVYSDDNDEGGAQGFGRDLNPLDDTRIHPECYVTHQFTQKICGDAMESEFHPTNYLPVVRGLMLKVREDLVKKLSKRGRYCLLIFSD